MSRRTGRNTRNELLARLREGPMPEEEMDRYCGSYDTVQPLLGKLRRDGHDIQRVTVYMLVELL